MRPKAPNGTDAPKATRSKPHNEGEKLVIRRLPPGMTEEECKAILGEEWQVGRGKIDWFEFAVGKVSTEFVFHIYLSGFSALRLGWLTLWAAQQSPRAQDAAICIS